MAMTKKERAEFDAAIERARLLGALRWTSKIAPDIPVPQDGETSGWRHNAYSIRVERAWSEPTAHGTGPQRDRSGRSVASQCGIPLYSTKLLALKAMRHEMEMEYARKLALADRMIAETEAAEQKQLAGGRVMVVRSKHDQERGAGRV